MAYVLGFIYADGIIYPSARGKYLVITSTDQFIVRRIKKWLASKHKIVRTKSTWPNGKDRFVLRVGNKAIYNSLSEVGLISSKSLIVRMPDVPKSYFKDFVRGYFDGDGCVYLERSKGKGGKLIIRKLSVIFTSGSREFLNDLLLDLKENLDLRQTKIYKGCRSFQLRFFTSDSIKILELMYNNTPRELYFERKFEVFTKYLKLSGKIDNYKGKLYNVVEPGHVVK